MFFLCFAKKDLRIEEEFSCEMYIIHILLYLTLQQHNIYKFIFILFCVSHNKRSNDKHETKKKKPENFYIFPRSSKYTRKDDKKFKYLYCPVSFFLKTRKLILFKWFVINNKIYKPTF